MKAHGTLIVFLMLLSILPTASVGQISLNPANTVLIVQSIVLSNISNSALGLSGNLNYLNTFWNATYFPTSPDRIGAKCYLNCPYVSGDLEASCTSPSIQNCTYLGSQGTASCTMTNPHYFFNFQQNNITCKFYDPDNPSFNFTPYPTSVFQPLNFTPFVSGLTATVGSIVQWKISVLNLGLLNDSYNITIVNPSNILQITPLTMNTSSVSYTESASMYPQVIFLSSAIPNAQIQVSTASNTNPLTNITLTIQLKSGFNSLPDFDTKGLALIVIVSSIIFAIGTLKKPSA